MGKTKFLYGAIGLMTLGMTACSSEEPVNTGNETAKTDEVRYLSVQLSSPVNNTRAFEDGTAAESKVTRLDFIFYDAAGNPTASPQSFTKENLDDDFTKGPFENGNVTKIWTSVVPVNLVQGQNLPAQVVCLVNGKVNAVNDIASRPLSELREIERDYFANGQDFVMSNSVYFGLNVLTGQNNERLCATPINANSQLFGTEAEAKQAIENASAEGASQAALVNIYVERLAAKVGMTLAPTAIENYTLANGEGEGDVTLTFTPDFWFMNAVAKENYLTKRYGVMNGTEVNMQPTYDQINNAFTGTVMASTWNDPTNHRSYWGCSPSYYNANYPLVSDQLNDLDGNGVAGTENDYYVKYYSFNELSGVAGANDVASQAYAWDATNGFNKAYLYTRETTTTINNINNTADNPAATVASAVVVGQYTVAGADEAKTFYVDANNGAKGTYYANESKVRDVLTARQFIVFTDNQGQTPAGADIFTVAHPKKSVREKLANKNIAGRLVTLQLEAAPETAAVYYYNGTNYVPVTAANLDDVNALLATVGYMNMYNNGRAFFNIPIRHLGFRDASYANGKYKWGEMQLGELGLVRNHVYNIEVSKISGLGTGLRDDNQPIIPAKDDVNQYVAMRLNILAWNIANSWAVEL